MTSPTDPLREEKMGRISNLNVRLLSDSSVFYTYETGGKRIDGSSRTWEEFAGLLIALVSG